MKKRRVMALLLSGLVATTVAFSAQDLTDAVRAGDLARVKVLIEKDPQLVKVKNPSGQTILFGALSSRRLEIAEYLIATGADVNEQDGFYLRPLHIACRGVGSIEFVRLLVEKGADVNAVAKYQGTPLDLAEDAGDPVVIQYLKSKGAQDTPLDLQVVTLTEGVHRIAYPWGMRNNLVVFSGADGSLIIDTGFRKRAVPAIRKIIGGFSKGEIRYVINTHPHGDHVAGNAIVPETQVITKRNLDSGNFQAILSKTTQPLRGRAGRELPAPHTMVFNGEKIQIVSYPGVHSPDDLLVYFPKSNVLCMGDLLLSQSCPAVQNATAYMEFLDKVLDIFPPQTIFVSGHGRDLTFDELKIYRAALAEMAAIVKKHRDAGKSVEDMIKEDILKAYKPAYSQLDWLGPDSWIVTAAQSGSLK
jgi:cyclase